MISKKLRYLLIFLILSLPIFLWGQDQSVCLHTNLDPALNAFLVRSDYLGEHQDKSPKELASQILKDMEYPCQIHDTTLALVYHKIGVTYRNNQAFRDFTKAVAFYKRALKLRQKFYIIAHESEDVIRGFHNIGSNYQALVWEGQTFLIDSSKYYFTQSLKLNLKRAEFDMEPTNLIGSTYRQLGRLYTDYGDAENARVCLLAAIKYLQKNPGLAPRLALARNDMAGLLTTYFDDSNSALTYSNQAIFYLDSSSFFSYLPDAYLNRGISYIRLDSISQAIEDFQQALNILDLYERSEDDKALIHINLGVAYNRKKQFQEALIPLHKVAELGIENNNKALLSLVYDNIGDSWAGLGNFDSALYTYQKALTYFSHDFSPNHIFENPKIGSRTVYKQSAFLRTLGSKIKTLNQIFQSNPSDTSFLFAAFDGVLSLDSLANRIRQSYRTDGSKTSLARHTKPIYEDAIQTCLLLFRQTEDIAYIEMAFKLSEESKATLLLDAIQHLKAQRFTLNSQEQATLKKLQLKSAYFQELFAEFELNSKHNPGIDNPYSDSLTRYRQEEKEYTDLLTKNNQDFAKLTQSIPVLSPTEIRQTVLAENQGIIEYFVGEKSLYTFFISKDTLLFHQTLLDQPLDQWVINLRNSITGFDLGDSKQNLSDFENEFRYNSNYLYELLISPIEKTVLEKTGKNLPERLIIVRDDILGLLPFEVLGPETKDKNLGFSDFPYLIKEKTISYSFSAFSTANFIQNKVNPRQKFIGFAPTYFGNIQNYRGELNELNNTEEEVSQLLELFNGSVFLKEKASKRQFYKYAPNYSIISIASHGLLNEQDPQYNGIALWDSILYTASLYQLNLNADLIILSGCETGIGELIPGEGIASLAKGFSSTGAKSILATQWVINNQNSQELLFKFSENLKIGMPKDIALREAKLAMIELFNPYSWAAFELRGDVSSISLPNDYTSYILLGIGLLIIFVIISWWVLTKKNIIGRSSQE